MCVHVCLRACLRVCSPAPVYVSPGAGQAKVQHLTQNQKAATCQTGRRAGETVSGGETVSSDLTLTQARSSGVKGAATAAKKARAVRRCRVRDTSGLAGAGTEERCQGSSSEPEEGAGGGPASDV